MNNSLHQGTEVVSINFFSVFVALPRVIAACLEESVWLKGRMFLLLREGIWKEIPK